MHIRQIAGAALWTATGFYLLYLTFHRHKHPGAHRVIFPLGHLRLIDGFLAELPLGIYLDLPPLIRLLIRPVRLQKMSLYIVLQLHFQDMENLFLQLLILHRENNLHPFIQVPGHPVGASHVDLAGAAVFKIEDPAVLQEVPHDGAHLDIFA